MKRSFVLLGTILVLMVFGFSIYDFAYLASLEKNQSQKCYAERGGAFTGIGVGSANGFYRNDGEKLLQDLNKAQNRFERCEKEAHLLRMF